MFCKSTNRITLMVTVSLSWRVSEGNPAGCSTLCWVPVIQQVLDLSCLSKVPSMNRAATSFWCFLHGSCLFLFNYWGKTLKYFSNIPLPSLLLSSPTENFSCLTEICDCILSHFARISQGRRWTVIIALGRWRGLWMLWCDGVLKKACSGQNLSPVPG